MSIDRNENQVLLSARHAFERYFPARKKNFPDWLLVFGVLKYMESLYAASQYDVNDLLVSESTVTKQDFQNFLDLSIASGQVSDLAAEAGAYSGESDFSMEKLAAMVTYLTSRGQKICRAKLEKLLFYCDFSNYFLHASSISGTRYIRERFGPRFESFDNRLVTLILDGVVRVEDGYERNENIVACDPSVMGTLTMLEIAAIHWVHLEFGSLSSSELAIQLQNESMYRFTRLGGNIAYEYSRLLNNLPDWSAG